LLLKNKINQLFLSFICCRLGRSRIEKKRKEKKRLERNRKKVWEKHKKNLRKKIRKVKE
jgi:stalled ribosome alternative rescue factor ArfA